MWCTARALNLRRDHAREIENLADMADAQAGEVPEFQIDDEREPRTHQAGGGYSFCAFYSWHQSSRLQQLL